MAHAVAAVLTRFADPVRRAFGASPGADGPKEGFRFVAGDVLGLAAVVLQRHGLAVFSPAAKAAFVPALALPLVPVFAGDVPAAFCAFASPEYAVIPSVMPVASISALNQFVIFSYLIRCV